MGWISGNTSFCGLSSCEYFTINFDMDFYRGTSRLWLLSVACSFNEQPLSRDVSKYMPVTLVCTFKYTDVHLDVSLF